MSFSLARLNLPALEDELRERLARLADDVAVAVERTRLDELLAPDALQSLLDRSGITALDRMEIRNLDDLAALADRLPAGLACPDATGEATTPRLDLPREELAVAAALGAAPRIVAALGPQAETVAARGETFVITTRYDDPETGFSALRLTSLEDGSEVFAVDGLEVGSAADGVAALTLGRLQVGSEAFRAMVADAAALGAAGEAVLFTGPSLGGAVAQVAAYETAESLLAAGAPGAVQLVTVDALGGVDAARALNGGTLEPEVLAQIEALNIRTEGDIVSRIGSHIGPTLTLPGRDAAGEVVTLTAAEAHVNEVSLLWNFSTDVVFATGVEGPPAEIGGFAAASNAAADELVALWLASGAEADATPLPLQIRGETALDADRTTWSLDADRDGSVDIAVGLSSPLDPGRDALVLM